MAWDQTRVGGARDRCRMEAGAEGCSDLQAKPRSLAGRLGCDYQISLAGWPELNCHVPWFSRSPSGFWEGGQTSKSAWPGPDMV